VTQKRAMEAWLPAKLLWIDALAALVAGLLTFALVSLLQRLYGLPESIIHFVGFVNLAYAAYSLSVARAVKRSRLRVKVLAWGNLAWAPVCALLAIAFADTATWLGLAMLLFEGAFVATLGVLELRYLPDLVR
jgi:hypothetical protein